jgi:uncharacterized protein YfaS (alpha-2-macroglobulin family)
VGDVVKVTLEISAQSDMSWVVVDDPIPAGASIQGSGLGRIRKSLAQAHGRATVPTMSNAALPVIALITALSRAAS